MAQLKYDITPRNVPRFAADIVAAVEKNEGVALDYSVVSLEVIARIIAGFRSEGVKVEQVEATLFAFGCYVGEVFVRNAGATWRKASQREMEDIFGVPLILEVGKENLVNPIGKVIKRLQNGDEDNLPY